MNVLLCIVKYKRAAVRQLAAQGYAVPTGKLQEHFLAQLAKVSGDDEVKVLRPCFQILKMSPDGGLS